MGPHLAQATSLRKEEAHAASANGPFTRPYNVQEGWDPNDLLHPAQAFEHPSHVVNDPDLTLNEKRAILASWASDACAPEAALIYVAPRE